MVRVEAVREHSVKQTQIVSSFAFVFCFCALAVSASLFQFQEKIMALIAIGVAVGFMIPPLLNFCKCPEMARYTLLVNSNLAIYTFSASLGLASETHMWFFTAAIFPFVIYRLHEVKSLLFFIFLPFALLIFLNLTHFQHPILAPIPLNTTATQSISLLMIFLSQFTAILSVYVIAKNLHAANIKSQDRAKIILNSAQAKAIESEKYLRVVLDSIQQGVWGLDTDGKVSFINQTAVRLLGYANETEIIGQPMHSLVHYAHADGSPHPQKDCPMYDSFRNGTTHHVPKDVLWRKDGSKFPIAYYSAPIFRDAKCIGSVVSFEDLSEHEALKQQVEMEQQKSIRNAKLASLGEMSAGIAHEINNPLSIISGTVELLPYSVDNPEKLAAKIANIKNGVGRIVKIIAGLKKFSRAGDKVEYSPHSLEQTVKEALVLCEASAKKNGVSISFDSQSTALINCNEIEIEQVLINLINNSIDAIKEQSKKWIKILLFEKDSFLILQLSDSGTGIPEHLRHKIFEPFFTTKKIGEGTGLGLSISKGILDEHGANIHVLDGTENTCFEMKFEKLRTKS